jgi:hypothetical protein
VAVGVIALAVARRADEDVQTQVRTTTVSRLVSEQASRLGTRSTLRRIPPAAGIPAQLLVIENRSDVPARNDENLRGIRVSILQRSYGSWETVYERGFMRGWMGTWLEDLTRDGHLDVLVVSEQGSGGCGEHIVVASVRRRPREIYRRATCETWHSLRDGRLVVDEPVGPCPDRLARAHCSGGRRTSILRWSGTRLVPESARVKCSSPELDPANECRER